MSNPKIIFRADGNKTIGLGHFIRSLALAEMLNQDFYCIFATQSPNSFQKEAVNKVCHQLIELPANDTHFQVFLNTLKGDEIVVLDNYYFETNDQKKIKNLGCTLVSIDDMHDKHYVSDLIINQATGVRREDYSCEAYTKFALGNNYAILRSEFLEATQSNRTLKTGDLSVLISLGGSNPEELLKQVVTFFLQQTEVHTIHLIANINPVALQNPQSKAIHTHWGLSAKALSTLMLECDLGVLPASTMALEACACRLPLLCGWFVDNQVNAYQGLIDHGVAVGIQNINQLSNDVMTEAFKEITQEQRMQELIANQMIYIDGDSKLRLINAFKNLC